MEKMQKETCDAVLIFLPIRLSVLLIYFREKSRGCIESSQIFDLPLLNLNNATDLFPRVSYQLSSSSWSLGKFYPAVKEKIR
jgi:hypothetical protein